MKTCLNCARTEEQIPLLVLQVRHEAIHICPQCLPLRAARPQWVPCSGLRG